MDSWNALIERRMETDAVADETRGEHEKVSALLARHGLRATRQRAAVYEALVATKSHPTADELYRQVQPRVDRLSLATVYNTLEALCAAGLARKHAVVNGSCRYDADMSEHLHLRHRDTGEIEDIPAPLGQRLLDHLPANVLREIEEALHIRIDGLSIQIVGSRRPEARG